MDRRQFLATTGALSALGFTGCGGDPAGGTTDTPESGADGDGSPGSAATATATPAGTPLTGGSQTPASGGTPTSDRPSGIYVQTFRERMSMQGTAASGDYAFALMFTVPHTFWTVTGGEFSKTAIEDGDSLHLMATVWDPETRTVLPETGLSVEITRDGGLVSQEVIYPMLSQPMGFHYGGNFSLDGDGTYTATLSVGGTTVRRTGAFADRFGEPASIEIPLTFTAATREEIATRPFDRGGEAGALRPMDASFPQSVVPTPEELPGTVRGEAMTDDARFVVTTLPSPPAGVDGDGPYIAVSARTRYNSYVLPAMALDATLTRDGETVFQGPFQRTLDPDLRYHYGVAVDGVESGDELTLSVATIPQVARHEGYETAFRQMGDVSVTF
jgi:hypothetical protein